MEQMLTICYFITTISHIYKNSISCIAGYLSIAQYKQVKPQHFLLHYLIYLLLTFITVSCINLISALYYTSSLIFSHFMLFCNVMANEYMHKVPLGFQRFSMVKGLHLSYCGTHMTHQHTKGQIQFLVPGPSESTPNIKKSTIMPKFRPPIMCSGV